MFQPEIIAKSRKNTSTFSAAGRAMTQLGGLPVGAGKGVLHEIGGIFGKKEKSKDEHDLPPVPHLPAGQASHPIGQPDHLATSAEAGGFGGTATSFSAAEANGSSGIKTDPGTLRVTVLGAKDLSVTDSKAYCSLRVGDKEHKTKHAGKTATPEWNESFNFTAGPLTPKLFVWIFDHKTIGKDKMLGQGEIDIWRHLQQGHTSAVEVSCELTDGGGLLHLRLEFDADANPMSRASTASSTDRIPNLGSPSRFSLRGRRPTGVED